MDFFQAFNQSGIIAKMSLLAGFVPLGFALAYAVRPAERTLVILRPVSLASIFAGICGLMAGLIAILRGVAATSGPVASVPALYVGLSEALVAIFVNTGILAISWLLVAVGMLRRQRQA